MKIVLLCLLFCPVYSVAAMQSRVVVKGKAISLRDAVRQIEKSSEYKFFYKSDDLGEDTKDLNCEGDITEVLD